MSYMHTQHACLLLVTGDDESLWADSLTARDLFNANRSNFSLIA